MLRKILIVLAALVGLGAALLAAGWFGLHHYAQTPGPLSAETAITLPRGAGIREIAHSLEAQGVVNKVWLFTVYAISTRQAGQIKAGEYAFAPGITPAQVLEKLVQGRTVIHKLTVPEGLTSWQIRQLLLGNDRLEGELPEDLPEGVYLPETYHFIRGDARSDLLERMRHAMEAVLQDAWPKRREGLPFASAQEAVTLASIVERETGLPQERPRVAAVFINRLKVGMKLQADPTVAYAVSQKKGGLERELTLDDLAAEHPYNTYAVVGLPPGPIANPGRASIEAVLHPADSAEYYFVADGKGGHRFARTLEEHQRNVQEYRAWQRGQKYSDSK